jgi:exodeoxyribonuclease VII large subunit
MSLDGSDAEKTSVLTVSQLNGLVKDCLESTFPALAVVGEIGEVSRPQSGHLYFSLKDNSSVIRAVMWRSAATRLKFDLTDGLEVVCFGALDVYPPRGAYQLVVQRVQERGAGAMQKAFRERFERLAKEGLFDQARKKPLPSFPHKIAVITSPTGAAIRDFLQALRPRWPANQILIVPVRVQGQSAAEEIAAAIRRLSNLEIPPDIVVITRGGGSIEDLWSFNEEIIVRAIAECPFATISAIGHEIDVTLADFAADLRALTPTDAAQQIAFSQKEIAEQLAVASSRLQKALQRKVERARERLTAISQRPLFRRPFDRLTTLARRVDELEHRLHQGVQSRYKKAVASLQTLTAKLDTISPLATLRRGYSITLLAGDGQPILNAASIDVGSEIETRLHRGTIRSRVERIQPSQDE